MPRESGMIHAPHAGLALAMHPHIIARLYLYLEMLRVYKEA